MKEKVENLKKKIMALEESQNKQIEQKSNLVNSTDPYSKKSESKVIFVSSPERLETVDFHVSSDDDLSCKSNYKVHQ